MQTPDDIRPRTHTIMKTHKLSSLIAFGALLPLSAWGQASEETAEKPGADARDTHTPSGAGSIEKRPGHNSPHYNSPSERQRSNNMSTQPSQGGAATTQGLGQGMSDQQIQRVSSDQLEQRVTASSLMGKKVVDREGQEIGKVKDIGLAGVAPQLSEAGDQAGQQRIAGRETTGMRQQPGAATEPSPGLQASGTDGRERRNDPYLAEQRRQREVDRAGTAGSDTGMAAGQDRQQSESRQWARNQSLSQDVGGEARIFVQPDRSLGARGDLVAIPASQIHREGNQLRLDMSRDELRLLIAQQASERVSMVE